MMVYYYLSMKCKIFAALASEEEKARLFNLKIALVCSTFTLNDSCLNLNNIDSFLEYEAHLINMSDMLTIQI